MREKKRNYSCLKVVCCFSSQLLAGKINDCYSLKSFFWFRSNLSDAYKKNHAAVTNKSYLWPWLWVCSRLCQWAVSFFFYWRLTKLAAVQSLNLTLNLSSWERRKQGKPDDESPRWGFSEAVAVSESCGRRFSALLSEQFRVVGCSSGWSLFAVLSCIWHTHKTSSVCLSRHETLLR